MGGRRQWRLGFGWAGLLGAVLWVAVVWRAPAQSRMVVPAPADARSLRVVEDETPVFVTPSTDAKRRGTVAVGTRLPMLERLYGEGCDREVWFKVGPEAHVCGEHVRYDRKPPGGTPVGEVAPGALLPHRYAFVRWDAARAYAHPSTYFADDYVEALGKGFGLVVTGRTTYQGEAFVRTRKGLWVHHQALRWAKGTDFAGMALHGGEATTQAWVLAEGAPVRVRPGGPVQRRAGRRAVVQVAGVQGRWVRLADGGYMDDRHLARLTTAAPPEGLAPDERWVDVDETEQTLIAYEGERPVYATLVSTGRDLRTHRTPRGIFRVWVKLVFSDMDDLQREDVSRNYAIEQVPWVQYFEGSYGFHAAFWHDDFGRKRSHGCINLAPRDAQWLFSFTKPDLPTGWSAILPTEREQSTLVRVR
jgi:hypothetical protein